MHINAVVNETCINNITTNTPLDCDWIGVAVEVDGELNLFLSDDGAVEGVAVFALLRVRVVQ